MKQKQSIYTSILWVLFGFALISAVHSLIVVCIYVYFHYGLFDGFLDIHFQYYIPAYSLGVTFLLGLIISFLLKKKISTLSISATKLPWLLFMILVIIAAVVKPVIEIWSDKNIMLLYDDLSKSEYLSRLNLVKIDNTIKYSSIGALWLLFILLLVIFLFLNRKSKD